MSETTITIPETTVTEIAADIYRISTFIPQVTPIGFTFNQFLVNADEPLLFHCGMRGIFPQVQQAVAKILPVNSLRWITFGHVESDECGAMNNWLAAAPQAHVAHGMTACMVSLNDLAIESVQPDSPVKHGISKLAHTLAAVCQRRIRCGSMASWTPNSPPTTSSYRPNGRPRSWRT